jgi:hypothetical protein
MKPDWPADTGVMVRRRPDSWEGFQVLVDHRKSGSIGGFYGNGTGGFHAVPFLLDATYDNEGRPIGLIVEDPTTTLEPMTPDKPACSPGVVTLQTSWPAGDSATGTSYGSGASAPSRRSRLGSTTCSSPRSTLRR